MFNVAVMVALMAGVMEASSDLGIIGAKKSPPELGINLPEFDQEHIRKDEKTLTREAELKCWTCYTQDTLSVNTDNCNKTLCTGKAISACYKWQVKYGFKKWRIYRGCMDNYTEIDYTTAMCKGTGLPLNETCDWVMCDTDMCNSAPAKLFSYTYLLIVLILAYWVQNKGHYYKWPGSDFN